MIALRLKEQYVGKSFTLHVLKKGISITSQDVMGSPFFSINSMESGQYFDLTPEEHAEIKSWPVAKAIQMDKILMAKLDSDFAPEFVSPRSTPKIIIGKTLEQKINVRQDPQNPIVTVDAMVENDKVEVLAIINDSEKGYITVHLQSKRGMEPDKTSILLTGLTQFGRTITKDIPLTIAKTKKT